MSTLSKVFVILILIVSLVYLGITATLFAHRVEYKDKLSKMQTAYGDLEKKLKETVTAKDTEISGQATQIDNLRGEKSVAETARKSLETELEKTHTGFDTLKQSYDKMAAEIKSVKDSLDAERKTNEGLQEKLKELQAQKEAAITDKDVTQAKLLDTENRLAISEKNLADLEVQYITRMKDLDESKLQLAKLREAGIPVEVISTGMVKHVEGKVLAVSEKMNLMIISAGKDKGVEQGYQFTVFRGGKYVGKVQVQKADKDWSSAAALATFMKEGEKVQVGDSVSTRP
ncbi:MAG: hypothetical protein HYZ53_10855 [Planctomycetes bacterium]|nr:hypothetical protein [Planctomycetota bacterium]